MAAPAKLVSTSIGFQDAKGNVVANGMLMLTLSQTATVTATGGQVTIEPIYLNLDANGKITSTAIWFQDELSPSGTIYYGVVYASNKMRVIPGLDKLQYSITGASYDLATAVQSAAASPSYSGAVLLTPIADQTITQNNLLPGTDNAQSFGSAVKRWIGQFAALTALTLNKITFTQPATSATLTIANGKTLAANNSLTLAGTDGTTINLPASGNVVGTTDTQALSGKTLTAPIITGTAPFNRFRANQGTALVAGDVGSLSGWGSGATASAVSGTDAAMKISITAGSSGFGANPAFTVTFHDGTWTAAPICQVTRGDVNSAGHAAATSTATTVSVTTNTTPSVPGQVFVFYITCTGI